MCLFEKMEEYIKNKKKNPKKRALLSWPMCTCAVSLMTSPSERMQYTVTQASGDQDTVGIREKEEDVCVPPANTWPLELTWKDSNKNKVFYQSNISFQVVTVISMSSHYYYISTLYSCIQHRDKQRKMSPQWLVFIDPYIWFLHVKVYVKWSKNNFRKCYSVQKN